MKKKVLSTVVLALAIGCAPTIGRKPIVYGISDWAKYREDLATCQNWSEQATGEDPSVADGVVSGGIGGALIGAALGAIVGGFLGDPGFGASFGTALGATEGAIGGGGYNYLSREERKKQAVSTCLDAHGYRVAI